MFKATKVFLQRLRSHAKTVFTTPRASRIFSFEARFLGLFRSKRMGLRIFGRSVILSTVTTIQQGPLI